MRAPIVALAAVFGLTSLSVSAFLQEKGGEELTGPYELVTNWPQPFARSGYIWGAQGGVFAETPNRIFLANRGELKLPEKLPPNFTGAWGSFGEQASVPTPELRNCIVVVDASGKMIEAWTQWDHLFQSGRGPHKVKISPYDPERHVWVIDDERHQIYQFTNDGKKLVMTLGEAGIQGDDDRHFARPQDIAWLPDGIFFVADGYINARVVKFDKTGKFLKAWGIKGDGPGQFNEVHGIEVDRNRRIYVADRANHRIQIFDENGKYLDQWPNIRSPNHILITADQHVWVGDGSTEKLLKYDMNGKLLYSWGSHGTYPGAFWELHQFSVDSDGNLYAAESYGGRTQKFRPKPGADRSKLIGAPVPLMQKALQ